MSRNECRCRNENSLRSQGLRAEEEYASADQKRINDFLEHELSKFQHINGPTTIAEHKILVTDERPLKLLYVSRNPAMKSIIDIEV